MQYDFFISHSSKDSEFSRKLATGLMVNGYKVWIDELNLNLGGFILREINKAINSSRYVIIVMSPVYFSSNWTQQE